MLPVQLHTLAHQGTDPSVPGIVGHQQDAYKAAFLARELWIGNPLVVKLLPNLHKNLGNLGHFFAG